jgi:hypothetical protein
LDIILLQRTFRCHNNREIWSKSDSGDFDLTLGVASGDTLDFAVYGSYLSGNTPISATISYGR